MLASLLSLEIKFYGFLKLTLKTMFPAPDEMFSMPCIIACHSYSGLASYDPIF